MNPSEDRLATVFSIPLILVMVAGFLFLALLNGHRDLALLTLLVLTVFCGAYLFSRVSFWRLSWQVTANRQRLFPGEEVTLTVQVANPKFLPVWVKVSAAMQPNGGVAPTAGALSGECSLLWHQQAHFTWSMTAQRRGVHTIGPCTITAADLFGLYPHEKPLTAPQVVVYPRLVPVQPIALPRREMFGIPGHRSPVQDPIYLLGTRDYRAGRPARFIHWKASARHHRLQEKIFDPSEQEKVLLALDVQSYGQSEAWPELERALEVVASLAVAFDRRASAFGFACNARMVGGAGPILSVAGHRHQVSALLDLLARIQPAATLDLKTVLSRGLTLPWGTSALVFSHTISAELLAVEYFFTQRRIPVVWVVTELPAAQPSEPVKVNCKIMSIDQIRAGHGSSP